MLRLIPAYTGAIHGAKVQVILVDDIDGELPRKHCLFPRRSFLRD